MIQIEWNEKKLNSFYNKMDKIAVNVYADKEIDIKKIIDDYNQDIPKYERVEYYKLYNDSIDTRLKQ